MRPPLINLMTQLTIVIAGMTQSGDKKVLMQQPSAPPAPPASAPSAPAAASLGPVSPGSRQPRPRQPRQPSARAATVPAAGRAVRWCGGSKALTRPQQRHLRSPISNIGPIDSTTRTHRVAQVKGNTTSG